MSSGTWGFSQHNTLLAGLTTRSEKTALSLGRSMQEPLWPRGCFICSSLCCEGTDRGGAWSRQSDPESRSKRTSVLFSEMHLARTWPDSQVIWKPPSHFHQPQPWFPVHSCREHGPRLSSGDSCSILPLRRFAGTAKSQSMPPLPGPGISGKHSGGGCDFVGPTLVSATWQQGFPGPWPACEPCVAQL